MKLQFGVTAKVFSLYEDFKKEAEKRGWTYNINFTSFEKNKMRSCNSLHFSSNWYIEDDYFFSFSNTSFQHKTFNLPEQWNEAIEFLDSHITTPIVVIDVSIDEIAAWKNVKPEQIRITM